MLSFYNSRRSIIDNKKLYREFCEQRQIYVPLFQQYWWMEAVCYDKQWDVALAYSGGTLLGAMPYHYGRKMGITYIIEPQLTQFSGPLYCYGELSGYSHRLEFEKNVARELLRQVESVNPALFLQNFSPQVTNWLPFFWAGYRQSTRYTYRIDDIGDLDRVFASFDVEKRQKKIHKYEKSTMVRFDMRPEDFARFHCKYWNEKGKGDLLSEDLIKRVCSNALERGQGVIASLHDAENRLLSARFVAFDDRCAYSLMSAHDLSLHRSGHSETLLWGLLKYLNGKVHSFDFEGSMDEGIEYFYRSFGAKQIPFFEISKTRGLSGLFLRLKQKR